MKVDVESLMEEVKSEWFTANIPADDGWLTTS
jgi:hypothetical protein